MKTNGNRSVRVLSFFICMMISAAGFAQTPVQASLQVHPVNCFGASDGWAEVIPGGGLVPDSIFWSNGATGLTANNLDAGVYGVTLSFPGGNTLILSDTIDSPDSLVVAALSIPQTYPAADGSIQLIVTGGTAPYTYYWSNGFTTQTISSLIAGTYAYSVYDAHQCLAADSVILPGQSPANGSLVSYFQVIPPSCPNICNGKIDVTVVGGIQPYQYQWSNGATTQDLLDVCSGTYSLTVTGSGSLPSPISFPWTLSNTGVNHSVLIAGGNVKVNGVNAPVGSYIGAFYNDNGALRCGGFVQLSGSSIALPVWGDDLSTPQKDGFSVGELFQWQIYLFGNTYPLTPQYTTTGDPGFYTDNGISVVTVLSGNVALSNIISFGQIQADSLLTSFQITPANPVYNSNGSVLLSVSGGHPPFSYNWSSGATTNNLLIAGYGDYSVTVTDSAGCIWQDSVFVDFSLLPDWRLEQNTNQAHRFFFDSASVLSLNGFDIPINTFIGAFYDSLGALACGGYAVFRGTESLQAGLMIPARDDVFSPGQHVYWKFWNPQTDKDYQAYASYSDDFVDDGVFVSGAESHIDSLQSVSINGQVLSGLQTGINQGTISAYRIDEPSVKFTKHNSLAGDGTFTLDGLPPAKYLLQIIPDGENYFPTYCSNDFHWSEADSVLAYGFTTGLQIYLADAHPCQVDCPGSISGNIQMPENLPDAPIEAGVQDVLVLLYDDDFRPVKFDITDALGDFSIHGLKLGFYYLRVEWPGYESEYFPVELTSLQQAVTGIHFSVQNNQILAASLQDEYSQLIYPNPATDYLFVDGFESIDNQLFIMIYQLDGRSINLPQSWIDSDRLRLDLRQLPVGVYFLYLLNQNQPSVFRFVKN